MKTHKKILLGLSLFIFLAALFLPLVSVFAYTESDLKNATYTLVSKSNLSVKIGNQTYTFTDSDITDTNYNWKPTSGTVGAPCVDSGAEKDGINNIGNRINPPGSLIGQALNIGQISGITRAGIACGNKVTVSDLTILNPNNITFGGQSVGTGEACTGGADCVNGVCKVPAGGGTPDCTTQNGGGNTAAQTGESCESASLISLEWLFCAVLRGIDGVVRSFYDQVEAQLCVKAGPSTTAGATQCGAGSDNILNDQVYSAWSTMRIIASVILVLAMLGMVIAQALNTGPLQAYTVRSLLPKLVAVAILIQISWFLGKFAIDIFNDIGVGIKELMYAPFGPNVGDIATALGRLSTGTQITIAGGLFAAGIAVVFSGLTVLGVAMLAVPVVLAIAVGYFVLLFRQLLIVLLMILVPIALVLWVLPGTERYWKLWRETFIKILMMFPLIMALIAAGRIFAYVGGGGSIPGLLIVLVGFFGPLFILPKTFSWGGGIFASVSNAAFNGTRGLRRRPAGAALSAAQQNRAQRAANRALRLAEGQSTGLRGYTDRALAGRYNPLKKGYVVGGPGTTIGKEYASTIAQGREEAEKTFAQSLIGSEFEKLSHPEKLKVLANVAQGNKDSVSGIDGSNPIAQRWALDEFAQLGDWDKISDLRDRGVIDNQTWQMFVAKNIGAIHQKAPHLSPLKSNLSTSISPEEMPGWHGEAFDELQRQFHGGYKRNGQTGAIEMISDPQELSEHRQRIKDIATKAIENTYIADRFTSDNRAKVEALSKADIQAPTARYIPPAGRSGGAGTVELPQDMSTPEAQASMRELLTSRSGYFAPAASAAIAERIAQTPPGSQDDVQIRSVLQGLQAQSSTSDIARKAHSDLAGEIDKRLGEVAKDTEEHAVSSGRSADEIAAMRRTAEQYRIQKLQSLGLSGPSPSASQPPAEGGLDIDHSDENR
ncbi:MAG TPA: hypothetical protein VFW52_03235 [Candidatus Saccharimonadales bacterium]|nr:hypothetical protein [Candidatus Saccharimonadales bacterium]